MDTTDPLERLTILERAQLLHDATLRRHGEILDRHADAMVELRGIQEQQERLMETLTTIAAQHGAHLETLTTIAAQHGVHLETLTTIAAQHEERMARLQQTLDAIKDMLERGNGH
jgi:hypothetical protein